MRQTGHFTVGGRDLRPHDHVAYAGRGSTDFSRLAMHVVASAAADERVVVCADPDWDAAELLDDEIESGRVLLLPTAGIYDAVLSGVPGAAQAQLRDFDAVVEGSLSLGYAGVRVVADNTPLLAEPGAPLDRWLEWEQTTDAWQATRPVTGVCYFAAERVDPGALAAVGHRHPLTGGLGAEPNWYVHHDFVDGEVDGVVAPALVGAVEVSDVPEFARVMRTEFAIGSADRSQPPLLDLSATTYLHHRAVEAIGAAAVLVRGRPARLVHAPSVVARLCGVLNLPSVQLVQP